jgi:ubiquinone biosynthesis monooxygenase Coq7
MTARANSDRSQGFTSRLGLVDTALVELGRALSVLSGGAMAARPYPAAGLAQNEALEPQEQRRSAGLMRINHVGEVCAQALYRGQASVCREPAVKDLLRGAAAEEVDHLAWCGTRLEELRSRPSLLNPLWYAGSFGLGVAASFAGVPRNLGFMAETEKQVEDHLDAHLQSLPAADERSREIVRQMKEDEIGHRLSAEAAGAVPMPAPGRFAMRVMSKVMTTIAYYL